MITLLGSLLGFLGSAFPNLLNIYREKKDREHELAILKLQMEQQAQGHAERLEEINAQADIAEASTIYHTYTTNIGWVDALNGTVRPVIAYAFFSLYAFVKFFQWQSGVLDLWTDEDWCIFSAVISFYFGQRAMNKFGSRLTKSS